MITGLTDTAGNWIETEQGVEQIATDYFSNLFQSCVSGSDIALIEAISPSISEEMNRKLLREITEAEVKKAIFAMHPEKSPGPDGMTALFYQQFWPSLKEDLLSLVREFFRTGVFDSRLNATNICLIPKTERPKGMAEFRPISLCNVCYKIISKVMCLRMKDILPGVISETQSAFVSGRLITDNILIAQEMFHSLRTNPKCKEEFMAIKTDMSKAYDRIEWGFLEAVLLRIGFHQDWVSRIMWCVRSVSFQVLINGKPKGLVLPERGLRQGDPLSPYLFILCTEVLTANLRRKQEEQSLTGLKIARGSPAISHLLFADDSLFFCKANEAECLGILALLGSYERGSGQVINFDKSSVMFGHKVPDRVKIHLKGVLGIHKEGGMGTYLGMPESLGGSKTKIFNFLNEKLNGRVNGWSSKLLSKGGKEILIKSVAFSLPNHVMSCFKLPQSLTSKLTSAISNFWWNSNGTNRGIHWSKWSNLCYSKTEGGLGFRCLENFNTALLAKQFWRLCQYPDLLVTRVLKGRYFRNAHPLFANKAYSPSYGWNSLISARDLILKGSRMTVGDGRSISVWEDPWLPEEYARPARGVGQEFYPDLTVNQLFNPDQRDWNVPLLNQLLDPVDVQLVRSIRVRSQFRADNLIWNFTKSGKYTVKSGYWLLQRENQHKEDNYIREPSFTALKAQAWKVQCPNKIRHFIWQMVSGSLAVMVRLRDRGMAVDTTCKRCGLEDETINHAIFECPSALQVWNLVQPSSAVTGFPSASVYSNLDYLFWRIPLNGVERNADTSVQFIYPWLLWFLWKSRNKKVFHGVEFEPNEILRLARSEYEDWRVAQIIEGPDNVEAPSIPDPHSEYFCQIDGSWLNSAPTSGLGWICYSGNSLVLLGGCGITRTITSLHSEFEALLWAMTVILEHEIPCFSFQTDCMELVKIVQDPEGWPAFDSLLEEFGALRRRFASFSLSHIRRETNSKADCLARSARTRSREFTYVNNLPPSWASNLGGNL